MDRKLNEIVNCLCCMLCGGLYEEATTIYLCLHTFCKRCIYEAVQETNCCPQCNVDLGSSPEEYLKDDEKIQSIAQKVKHILTAKGQVGAEAGDVKDGAGSSKPPGTTNQLEDQEVSGEKFHHKTADAEKENSSDQMSSQESSTFPTPASAPKMPQVACSVSTTNAEIGDSAIKDSVKEHKKKKRSKNRRARKFTVGETSKTEEKKPDIGPDDIYKDEHAKDTESSTSEKQVLKERQKDFWFELVPQGDTSGPRLPPLQKPHIRLKDSRITVSKIQKYIAQKLNMNDYTEVDVLCCSEKLKADMTLEDIQNIWKSHLPNKGKKKANWSMKEALVQLGYTRSEKP